MSVGNALSCCCDTGQQWLDCDFAYPDPVPVCSDIYTMSDFEATVNYQMRYRDGGDDVVSQWVPQYIPDGCTGTTACDLDTSITRSYTPALLAIRNAQMASNCKQVTNNVPYFPVPPTEFGPRAGTVLEYTGIGEQSASWPTPGRIDFGTASYAAYPLFPRFEVFTRCNVPPLYGQACPNWGEPHPSVPDGKFEMLVIQTQGVGFVEYCSGSTPLQRARWLAASGFSTEFANPFTINTFGTRTCDFQAIFLYWREYPSDPTDPEYTWTPGEYQFYGVRIGVFDYIIPPTGGATGGCGSSAGVSSLCSSSASATCCCCAATATGPLAPERRFYATVSSSNACGNGNRLRPSFGMFPWNAAAGDPLPPGLEFDCPETLEIS